MPQRADEIKEIIDRVSLPGFMRPLLGNDGDGILYLQIEAEGHGETIWRGRKWRLSPYMTEGEVVRTAFLAALAFVEHELREGFRYEGAAVFGPHIPIRALIDAAREPPEKRG